MEPEQSGSALPLDLLLSGGWVIDPANGLDGPADIGIASGKIARVGAGIPTAEAAQVVDVTGLIVTPGLIDMHTHVYKFRPQPTSYIEGVNPDAHLLASGVTTTVDVGTAGWKHFLDFKESTIDPCRVRVLALVNIAAGGMVQGDSEQQVDDLRPGLAAEVALAFPEIVVGIKTAHYWTRDPWDDIHQPWVSVDRAIEAGERCGLPVMVDFWPRPPERPYPDLILKKMRPGDIHTHVFAQQFPVLTAEGRVSDFMWKARERGVVFDLGHGAASFWFRNAVPALRDGFPPDTISTDLHMANINGPVVSLQQTLSKYLNMGMPLVEVVRRATLEPARVIRRTELGTLTPGREADVAIFRKLEGSFGFVDCGGGRLSGSQKLECALTIRGGKIVFDPSGLSMPEWEHAPEAYWHMPELQA